MKEFETIERIQAYVDEELPEAELAEVEALLQSDEALLGLSEELREGRELLRANELERAVPEPRDFYWSNIARGIEEIDQAGTPIESTVPSGRSLTDWLKWLVPVGGVAALLFLAMLSQFNGPQGNAKQTEKASSYHEVDSPLDSGSLITFRSNTEGVTVVWITSD